MADIKLEADYWETSGIRDITQNKTQRQINASLQADITDIQSDIGDMSSLDTQATNLVGAANELKGSLNSINNELQVNAFTNIPLIDNAYVSNTNGSFIEYNGWERTDYIPVDPSKTYILITTAGSTYNAVYDANKQFKRGLIVGVPSMELTFSEGDAYIALSFGGLSNVVKIKEKTILDNVINTRFKVISFNTGMLNYGSGAGIPSAGYDTKIKKWRQFFGNQATNIAGLQEIPEYANQSAATANAFNTALTAVFYNYVMQNHNVHLGLYSNMPMKFGNGGAFSTGRRYLDGTFKIGETEIFVINVHLTPTSATDRATETTELLNILAQHEYFVVTGDFNYAPDGESVTQYNRFTDAGYSVANTGWFGSWWTWSSNQADFANYDNPSGTVWYIDNIIISSNLHFKNVYCPNTYSQLTSDHIPCVAEIDLY